MIQFALDFLSCWRRGAYEKRESSSNPACSASKSLLYSHLREGCELLAVLRAFARLFERSRTGELTALASASQIGGILSARHCASPVSGEIRTREIL